jgi:hypothetical protein
MKQQGNSIPSHYTIPKNIHDAPRYTHKQGNKEKERNAAGFIWITRWTKSYGLCMI